MLLQYNMKNHGVVQAVKVFCGVVEFVGGLQVRKEFIQSESSTGIGVRQPGSPGRITESTWMVLPNGARFLVWEYSFDEHYRTPIVEISDKDWFEIMDRGALEKHLKYIRDKAETQCRHILHFSESGGYKPIISCELDAIEKSKKHVFYND